MQNSLFKPSIESAEFTRAFRLLRKDRFDHVVSKSNVAGKEYKVFFTQNGRKNSRLGIIVGKRTLPRSVDRNHIKRKIREAFRLHQVRGQMLDIVVLVKKFGSGTENISTHELNNLFNRIEQRCTKSLSN